MGGKSQPNYGDLAVQQGEANERVVRDQTYANRPDQYTPWGYTSWNSYQGVDPKTGEPVTKWEQTQGLTPELQDMLNKELAIQSGRSDIAGALTERAGQEFGAPMDWRGLSPMGMNPQAQFTIPEPDAGDPYQTRQRAEDAMYNSAMSRIAPQQQSERQALEIKMRNQGLSPGDEAWNAQMQNMGQRHTDQQQQAIWGSTGEGRAEAGQMYGQQMGRQAQNFQQALGANQQNFGQAMQQSQYANQLRQQQLTEAMQRRGFSLNEINALMSGQQVGLPQMPNFNQAQQAAAAPIYQAGVDQASTAAAMSPWNALIGAAGTAGGAYLGTL